MLNQFSIIVIRIYTCVERNNRTENTQHLIEQFKSR